MYTECPECQTEFRLTVTVLRQAHGRVRCGGCGHVFDALEYLREDEGGAIAEDPGATSAGARFERQSRELLKALDELAGPGDVRIEDTGVEWRVLDDGDEDDEADTPPAAATEDDGHNATGSLRWIIDDPAARDAAPATPAAAQESLDLDGDGSEMRYDDNTPLPDDFTETPAVPRRRAEDFSPPPVSSELQVDLALGDPDDWRALLDEVGDDAAGAAPPRGAADSAAPVVAAAELGEDGRRQLAAERELEAALADAAGQPQEDSSPAAARVVAKRDDEATPAADTTSDSDDQPLFETIVLEGDSVLAAEDDADEAPDPADTFVWRPVEPEPVTDAESTRPPWRAVAASAGLGLLLTLQLLHAHRDALATIAPLQRALAPIYRTLGQPLVPAWNVRGWHFEATNGRTDAGGARLTITSRIANDGERPLPYPLLHVALTDRFEDVIGSRVLTPAEYLAGGAHAAAAVAPGSDFTAVVTVDAPSPDATGFKLNVCYRTATEQLRCAVQDFKD